MHYEIFGLSDKLLDELPLVEADSPSKALKKLLKERGLNYKIRASASNNVVLVQPIFLDESGRRLIDARRRRLGFELLAS